MGNAIEYILEQVHGAWRFRWVAMMVAWPVCLLGWFWTLAIPDTYEASARVFVDTRTRLSQVTQGLAVESNLGSQVERVRAALFAGPQLSKVAETAQVPGYATATADRRATIVNGIRDRVTLTATGKLTEQGEMYVITYSDPSRETSLRVVDRLVKSFVGEALGNNRESSEQARRFLTQQIAEYDKKLADAENRLADFKRKNVGLMPSVAGDYFTRLRAEMDELDKERDQLSILEQKRGELQRQLTSEQPLLAGASGSNSAGGLDSLHGSDIGTRIRETQARIDDLLLRFTEKHPDVIALRQTLADLKARQKAEIEAVRKGDTAAIAAAGVTSNPIYQSIRLQLAQVDVDAAALKHEVADHSDKIADLRKMVNSAPEIEAEFARLNRDYDVTRGQYQSLVERLGRTRLSDEADETGSVRFEIVDPPSASAQPTAPNRPRLIIAVLFGGLGAGLAVAYLLHQLRPVFISTRQLTEITRLPVLGVVSMTWLERHQALARRAAWIYGAVGAALVLTAAITLVTSTQTSHLLHTLKI